MTGQQPVEQPDENEGLLFLFPYRRGRIPLVLVHGTASSPGRWADLVNELQHDRLIFEKYQIWLFLYNTGNPIGYSGGLLRRSLEKAVRSSIRRAPTTRCAAWSWSATARAGSSPS